jgi:hypothetical protein
MVILLSLLVIAGSLSLIFLPGRGTGNTPGGSTQPPQTQTHSSPTTAVSPTATPNLTATALAALAATATARAQATATAIAQITATANAQASATAGVIQTATSGQPNYTDALNNPNNPATMAAGWDNNSQCAFQSDGYHLTTGNGIKGCRESNINYGNAAITVQMRILSGQSGGVFFRLNTNLFGAYMGYLFEVDSTGKYRIVASDNYSLSNLTILQNWTTSGALHTGSASNTLQLIMRGTDLSFYANNAFLIHLTDSSYTSAGQIGFLASSDGTTQADVAYSNLSVYPVT